MKIGCPKEIKPQEFRVGLTPNAAREAVAHGHEVIIESGAGLGAGFDDAAYIEAGAHILDTAEEIFAITDMIGQLSLQTRRTRTGGAAIEITIDLEDPQEKR